jgi:hypothetical protein
LGSNQGIKDRFEVGAHDTVRTGKKRADRAGACAALAEAEVVETFDGPALHAFSERCGIRAIAGSAEGLER